MKANELRIGNWVELNQTGETTYTTIQPSSFTVNAEIYFNPIPLTEEWLLKFGFEKDDRIYQIRIKQGTTEMIFTRVEEGCMDISQALDPNDDDCWECIYTTGVIKYVHQLQNLYFALTGEELTINEKANQQAAV